MRWQRRDLPAEKVSTFCHLELFLDFLCLPFSVQLARKGCLALLLVPARCCAGLIGYPCVFEKLRDARLVPGP